MRVYRLGWHQFLFEDGQAPQGAIEVKVPEVKTKDHAPRLPRPAVRKREQVRKADK